jgi:tRNA(fMet)-specific endonuclease VapC
MTRFLDSNTCIEFLRGRMPLALQMLQNTSPSAVKIPAIVAAELKVGALKSARPDENMRAVDLLLSPYEVIPFDENCTEAYARLRVHLESRGMKIGAHDALIATTVLVHEGVLVTSNVDEFRRVPGLSVETWAEITL